MRKERKIINILLTILLIFLTGLMLLYMGVMIYQTITYHLPVELRDLSTLRAADVFAAGGNPYSLQTIWASGNTPQLYQYTFLEPLIVSVFMRLTGADSLTISIILNTLYLLLTSFIMYKTNNDRHKIGIAGAVFIFFQTILLYTMFWGHRVAFTIRADGLGILIMAFIFYLMSHDDSREAMQKLFCDRTILIAFLSAILFATKQFYVVIFVPIFLYYIWTNTKKAVRYFVSCVIFGILELVLCQLAFPTYLTSTLYSQFMSAGTVGSFYDMAKNFGLIILRQELPVIIVFIVAVMEFWRSNLWKREDNLRRVINIAGENKFTSFAILAVICNFVFLIFLARNGMDGIKYINALLIIPVDILFFEAINYCRDRNVAHGLMPLIVLIVVLIPLNAYQYVPYSRQERADWNRLEQYVSETDYDKVFLAPVASMYFHNVENGMQQGYYDDGHLQYFEYAESTGVDDIFPGVNEQRLAIAEYKKMLHSKMENCELELLIIPDNLWCIDNDVVIKNYEKVDTLYLPAATNDTTVGVWTIKTR